MADVDGLSEDSVPCLDRCLAALRAAKSDTEVFAALLLVTKLVKADSTNTEVRRKIFDAVGFTFLNRLLNTTEVPEGCDPNMFHSIGLTLLACFCTDPELAADPQMQSKIPIFNDVITSCKSLRGAELDGGVRGTVDDCYQCLLSIASAPDGQQQMIRHGSVQALCKACTEKCYGCEKSLPLIIQLLQQNGNQVWTYYDKVINQLLDSLSAQFRETQEKKKFVLCDSLFAVLSTASRPVIETLPYSVWSSNIYYGLSDILRSKIGAKQRDPALKLSALMIEHFGISWALGPEQDSSTKYLLLLVHLSCIEVRITLEDTSDGEKESRSSVISACYHMLESIIGYMTAEPTLSLTTKQITQLHSAMVGAFGAVVHYLTRMSEDKSNYTTPLVQASVRVLGAWLAEETSALKEDIYAIIPFLIDIGRESFYELKTRLSKDTAEDLGHTSSTGPLLVDLLRFLLPSLCHFSAEDVPRNILIENRTHELLGEYFNYHWLLFTAKNTEYNSEVVLTTLCGVFMNFTVQDPVFVESQQVFVELLNLLMSSLPLLLNQMEHIILTFNIAVLAMMLLRHYTDNEEISHSSTCQNFIRVFAQLFKSCHVVSDDGRCQVMESYQPFWLHVSELWFLGMQDLSGNIKSLNWIAKALMEQNWLRDILQMLKQVHTPTSEEAAILQFCSSVVTECAKYDNDCKNHIQELGGCTVAESINMKELSTALNDVK